jgi:alkanesulfonate monooxygenase SsuD/methylene tetrahydromethanopterin reductase-like flavin-dependent oxidoreductase (luciferase family)
MPAETRRGAQDCFVTNYLPTLATAPCATTDGSGRCSACAERGRDADSLVYSVTQVVCCGSDEATLARRAAAIGRDLPELRANGLAGSPAEIVDKIATFAEAGMQTLYLQVLDLDDLDHRSDIADGVLPQV